MEARVPVCSKVYRKTSNLKAACVTREFVQTLLDRKIAEGLC